jgi:predicted TIM-barrel fold metal-dependent hydrolase
LKRISILLSCFRADDLIEAYIDALLPSQITAIANLVAIDFPFSHNNPVHVEKVLRRYPDLTLIRKHHNVSLYDAWNQAVGLAETDYVSNLNLDDRVAPHYYALAAESLDLQQADVFSSQSITTSTIGEWSAGSTPTATSPL